MDNIDRPRLKPIKKKEDAELFGDFFEKCKQEKTAKDETVEESSKVVLTNKKKIPVKVTKKVRGKEVEVTEVDGIDISTPSPKFVALRREQNFISRRGVKPATKPQKVLTIDMINKVSNRNSKEPLAKDSQDITNELVKGDINLNGCEIAETVETKDVSDTKSWGKLEQDVKLRKLMSYAAKLKERDQLEEARFKLLKSALIFGLTKRKLTKKTDVIYDTELKEITDIPSLKYDTNDEVYRLDYDPQITKKVSKHLLKGGLIKLK